MRELAYLKHSIDDIGGGAGNGRDCFVGQRFGP